MSSVNDIFSIGQGNHHFYKFNMGKSSALTCGHDGTTGRGVGTSSIIRQGDSELESPVTKGCDVRDI